MLTRNRRKSGRGYSRDEWINHHKKIVERSEKVANLVRVEAGEKISKKMVEKANITDQERGVGEYLTQPGQKINVVERNGSEEQKQGIVGNVWAGNSSKSDEIRKATDKINDLSTTQHTDFSRDMSTVGTIELAQTTQAHGVQTKSFLHHTKLTTAGVDEEQKEHSKKLTKDVHFKDSGMEIY